jgi:hypothetical protein
LTAGLLGGSERTAGSMTSGGTESVLMAVKADRDRARSHDPANDAPEMVLHATAHPAFDKAAHVPSSASRNVGAAPSGTSIMAAMVLSELRVPSFDVLHGLTGAPGTGIIVSATFEANSRTVSTRRGGDR